MSQAPDSTLVAVATKHRLQIDLHFGHADEFNIFRVGPEGLEFVELRNVEHYCQGGFGDEDKREVILRVLADCAALFCAKVGDGPKGRLRDAGIEAVDAYAYGPVEGSVLEWFKTYSAA